MYIRMYICKYETPYRWCRRRRRGAIGTAASSCRRSSTCSGRTGSRAHQRTRTARYTILHHVQWDHTSQKQQKEEEKGAQRGGRKSKRNEERNSCVSSSSSVLHACLRYLSLDLSSHCNNILDLFISISWIGRNCEGLVFVRYRTHRWSSRHTSGTIWCRYSQWFLIAPALPQ